MELGKLLAELVTPVVDNVVVGELVLVFCILI